MGISNSFFEKLNSQNKKAQADTSGISPEFFSSFGNNAFTQPEQPGFFSHVFDTLKDFSKMIGSPPKYLEGTSPLEMEYGNVFGAQRDKLPTYQSDPEVEAARTQFKGANWSKLGDDIANGFIAIRDFGAWGNPAAQLRTAERLDDTGAALKKNLGEMFGGIGQTYEDKGLIGGTAGVAGNLASGFFDMTVKSPLEVLTGARLGEETIKALTPEEYNKQIKVTAGVVVGAVIGHAARAMAAEDAIANSKKLIGGNLDGIGKGVPVSDIKTQLSTLTNIGEINASLTPLPTENLLKLAQGAGVNKFGKIGRKIRAGLYEGAMAGAGQSLVENFGEDGAAAKVVSDMLLGASIGPLFELALPGEPVGRLGKDGAFTPEDTKWMGHQAFAAKQLMVNSDLLLREEGLAELFKRTKFVLEGDDLVDAVIAHQMDRIKKSEFVIIDGVTKDKVTAIEAKLNAAYEEGEKIKDQVEAEETKKSNKFKSESQEVGDLGPNNQLKIEVLFDKLVSPHPVDQYNPDVIYDANGQPTTVKIFDNYAGDFQGVDYKKLKEAFVKKYYKAALDAGSKEDPTGFKHIKVNEIKWIFDDAIREAQKGVPIGNLVMSGYAPANETIAKALGSDGIMSYGEEVLIDRKADAAQEDFLKQQKLVGIEYRKDTGRALLYDHREARGKYTNFFKDHGFLPGELVEQGGRDMIVTDAYSWQNIYLDNDTVVLMDPQTGQQVMANVATISPKNGVVGDHFFKSNESVKSQFFKEYKNDIKARNNPDASTVGKAARDYFEKFILKPLKLNGGDYATVTDINPIVFRGIRGQTIPGTGVFWSTKASTGLGYVHGTPGPENFAVARLPFKKFFVFNMGGWDLTNRFLQGDYMGLKVSDLEAKALSQARKVYDEKNFTGNSLGERYQQIRNIQNSFENKFYLFKSHQPYNMGNGEILVSVLHDLQRAGVGFARNRIIDFVNDLHADGLIEHPFDKVNDEVIYDPKWEKITPQQYLDFIERYEIKRYAKNAGKTHPESGYQLMDKIVARILRNNGYDGYVKRIYNGVQELVDLRDDRRVVEIKPSDGTRRPKFKLPDQGTEFTGTIYDTQKELELTDGFIETVKNSGWLTADKPEPFKQLIAEFANLSGILPEDIPNFENAVQRKLVSYLVQDSVSAEEFKVWNKALLDSIRRTNTSAEKAAEGVSRNARRLKKMASVAGYYLDRSDNGAFVFKDAKTHQEIVAIQDRAGAEEFLRQSGANFDSVDLINGMVDKTGGIVPPDGISSGLIDPPGGWDDDNFSEPFAYKQGVIANIRDWANTTSFGKYFAELPRRLRSFDSYLGTRLFSGVFEPIQHARSAEIAQKIDWLDRLQGIDNLTKGLTADQREQIFHYIETMSPDEIINNGMASRTMTIDEIDMAKDFHAMGVNDELFMTLRKEMRPYLKALQKGTIDEAMFKSQLASSAQALNVDPFTFQAYIKLHDKLRTNPSMTDFAIGPVMRLMRALKDPNAVPRDVFAKRFNMTAQQLKVAEQIDKYFADLVKLSGISDKQILNGYITHARKYTDNNINGAISDFTRIDPDARKFFASMSRTGELSAIETDPIKAALRYTNALFRTQYTEKAITRGLYEARRQLKLIKDGDVRKQLKQEISQYVEGIRGYPEQADKVAQSTFGMLWDKLFGEKKEPELRRELVNTGLNIFELGIQGFRVKAGLLDIFSNITLTYAEKGAERTLKTIKHGLAAIKDGRLEKLRASGAVPPELMALFFSDPEGEAAKGLAGKVKRTEAGISKLADVGLKFSGQKHVYAVMQVGTYIENWEYAAKKLMELRQGKLDKKAAYTDLNLQRYGNAVVSEFDRLVTNGETEKAANFYARVARDASQKVYGLARNPAWMQRNMGRIMGQFSAWPIWARSAILDGISSGTAKQRIAYLARYGIAASALAAIGEKYEMDFSNWMPHRGLLPGGGPGVQIAQDVVTAMAGSYGPEQDAAQKRLMKMVPYFGEDGINVGPMFPGGVALNDLIQAKEVAEQGYDTPAIYARMFGIQANTQDKDMMKQIFGWDWWED